MGEVIKGTRPYLIIDPDEEPDEEEETDDK